MDFTNGFYDLPGDKIATIVTSLEMFQKPDKFTSHLKTQFTLAKVSEPDVDWYRNLYRLVGEDWLWFSRIAMGDEELSRILDNPQIEIHALANNGREQGLLELDFRIEGECELAFLGVCGDAIGAGAGKWLMAKALEFAWSKPIKRMWVHTCTLDHPRALPFYVRSGFKPYQRKLEIADDPRISEMIPRHRAIHFPLLG